MTTTFLSCPKCGQQLEKTLEYFTAKTIGFHCPVCGWKQESQPKKKPTTAAQPSLFDKPESFQAQRDESIWWQK